MYSRARQFILRYRLIVIILLHALFAAGALFMSFMVRLDFTLLQHGTYWPYFVATVWINVGIFLLASAFFNMYQGIWRYVSVEDLIDIVKTAATGGLLFMAVIELSGRFSAFPRSVYLLNTAFFVLFNGGTRFAIRVFRESFAPQSEHARNVLIVGAGSAGNEIVKSLKTDKNREYIPVGFIDNDTSKVGKRIQGLPILGTTDTMRRHVLKHRVREIFIAIPQATNKVVKEIMDNAKVQEWEVRFKIVPSVLDIMSGKYSLNQIREVSITDLLSRPNITLDDTHVRKEIAGKTVLVTGAGGSIGAEISYQVAAYRPARLILLDLNEENAYRIDMGIKEKHRDIAVHTVVGNILDRGFMELLMKRYPPDFVLHAAAYKHVHLMEWNPIACIHNNFIGTDVLASVAERVGVKQFVMISTDKAVNPRGMMGISKRLAERAVLERHRSGTIFNVVRFGNVLGSSGSVIPLFQRQIKNGGPVTITDPKAKRYFMSIPEAVQLVLQASTLRESNAIFLLKMGEPVYINDLAKNLIELSGLKVGEDIEITYTGLRPGEKLQEDLLAKEENSYPTRFEKIRMQRNCICEPDDLKKMVADMRTLVELGNYKGMYELIQRAIPELQGPQFHELESNMFA